MITLTKLEAAKRHVNFTIESYFRREDMVPLCAIAGAAHILTHDLVEQRKPRASWAAVGSEAAGIELKETLSTIRRIPNWMKHADRDPEDELEFGSDELEFLLFHIILDLGELSAQGEYHSNEVSVFQMWFVSNHRELFTAEAYAKILKQAEESFPNLPKLSKEDKLQAGLETIEAMRRGVRR